MCVHAHFYLQGQSPLASQATGSEDTQGRTMLWLHHVDSFPLPWSPVPVALVLKVETRPIYTRTQVRRHLMQCIVYVSAYINYVTVRCHRKIAEINLNMALSMSNGNCTRHVTIPTQTLPTVKVLHRLHKWPLNV